MANRIRAWHMKTPARPDLIIATMSQCITKGVGRDLQSFMLVKFSSQIG